MILDRRAMVFHCLKRSYPFLLSWFHRDDIEQDVSLFLLECSDTDVTAFATSCVYFFYHRAVAYGYLKSSVDRVDERIQVWMPEPCISLVDEFDDGEEFDLADLQQYRSWSHGLLENSDDLGDRVGAEEERQVVRFSLLSLSPKIRIAMELYYYYGLTNSQIARFLNLSLEAVSSRLYVGLSRLRSFLPSVRSDICPGTVAVPVVSAEDAVFVTLAPIDVAQLQNEFVCVVCGSSFFAKNYGGDRSPKFCSDSCRSQHQRARIKGLSLQSGRRDSDPRPSPWQGDVSGSS